MRNLLFMTISVLVLMVTTVGLASADGDPHSYTTDQCVQCHRTSTNDTSLVENNITTLCMNCHGTGLGANTNVADGVYLSSRDDAAANKNVGATHTLDGASLLGGGFATYNGSPVTSAHNVNRETAIAWGNGSNQNQTASLNNSLTCISCHDPHGSNNYRNLRENINGHPVAVAQVDEGPAKDYDTEQWDTGTDSLCAACHQTDHVITTNFGNDETLVAPNSYAHPVGIPYTYGNNLNPETVGYQGFHLPLAQSGNGDIVVCMTCHLSHGSSAQVSAGNQSSTLLRLDNSGVCQTCHQK